MTEPNQLVAIVQQSGLQENKIESLMESFAGHFKEAQKVANESRNIVVTEETQTELMAKARESRLKLKAIRVEVEKTRVDLKEQSLREGRAIDGVANVIKALIVPVEEHLEKQEKYAEIREMERLNKRYEERITVLTPYVDDITLYTLKDMSDAAFANLLQSSKNAWQAKKDAEAKAEAERIEKERNEAEEREKIRLENEKLRKEAEEREKIVAKERRLQEEKLIAERKAREEAEAKLRREKEEQFRKEQELKAAEEARIKAEEEAKRKALLAPDKEKLIGFADMIDKLSAPQVASRDAGIVIEQAESKLFSVSNFIREKAKAL